LEERGEKLDTIEGIVPSPLDFPTGCRFRTRCKYATAKCAEEEPQLERCGEGHFVACHYWPQVIDGSKDQTGPYTEDIDE